MCKRFAAVLLGLALCCFGLAAGAANHTKDDAVKMTNKAVAFFKSNGKEKFLAAIMDKNGMFRDGELYVSALDLNGTVMAHPANPKLVGRNFNDIPDLDGKFFRRDFLEVANTKGSGWVDYKYRNPESGKAEPKTSYVLKVDDLILICGIYKH